MKILKDNPIKDIPDIRLYEFTYDNARYVAFAPNSWQGWYVAYRADLINAAAKLRSCQDVDRERLMDALCDNELSDAGSMEMALALYEEQGMNIFKFHNESWLPRKIIEEERKRNETRLRLIRDANK